MVDLSGFNSNQRQAVEWQDGPLLVLAGPGSGKTRVLVYRIARLLEESPESYFRVLALAFTNKAVAEMRARLDELAPGCAERALLTTFHSFAADLLRQHGSHVGLRPDFSILSQDADRHALLGEAMSQVKVFQPSERMLPLVTRLAEADIAPGDALPFLRESLLGNPEALAAVYQRYRALMVERNSMDFCGIIAEALSLLKKSAGIRKHVRVVYPYICVDEFQDTNFSQYETLCQVVNPDTKNLFVVADDDQIIYQWNGAKPERLDVLRRHFDMELLQLPKSYRCPPRVVDLANHLIACNPNRIAEKGALQAYKQECTPSSVQCQGFDDFAGEADWVAQDIAARDRAAQARCVVLARTRKLIEQVLVALDRRGLDGHLAIRKNEFESAPMRWLHAVLRLAHSRNRREYLRRVCDAFFVIEGIRVDFEDVVAHAGIGDGDCLRSWVAEALRQNLSQKSRDLLERSLAPKLVDRLDALGFEEDASQWLDNLSDAAPGSTDMIAEYGEEKETWKQLVNEITMQHGRREITLHLLLQELDLRSKSPEPPPGAIPCFTIHAAKGMEFDHVYLVGMVEDLLPHWAAVKKGDDSREMQEERRGCFVAITRTQETLTLTYSGNVLGRPRRPSRFLYEMGLLED